MSSQSTGIPPSASRIRLQFSDHRRPPLDIDVKVLLKEMLDADGSDLFLTCDAAPSMKAFGKMVPMREERFAPGDVKRIAYSIMND